MAVRDRELKGLQGFPGGLNNLARETDLATGEAGRDGVVRGELRVAENIDLTDDGKVQTAPGYTLEDDAPGLHSLWADPRFAFLLGVYDGNLVAYDSGLQRAVVTALDHPTQPVSYDVGPGGWVFWANGFECGRVSPEGVAGFAAPEHPNGYPDVAAFGSGGLHVGTYAAAVCFVDAFGRHGGACPAVEVAITEGQGVRLTQIPQPVRADTARVRVALTEADGTVLRAVADLPVGVTSYTIGVHTPGPPLETDFLEPIPAPRLVAWWNMRGLGAKGRTLVIGEAGRPWLANLAQSYYGFPADITLLAAVGGSGLYVATLATEAREGSTYYLGGEDPAKFTRVRCYPHGAVPGSVCYVEAKELALEGVEPDLRVPVWLADDGQLVAGLPGGRVRQLHRARYEALNRPERAATALREYQGVRTLLTSLRGGTVGRLRVTDAASAERWRNVNGTLVRVADDA